ncbi:hypothetical protein E2C01_033876 [Portunus trituberculatus]|uniref:Uncharacterized protein n=1 Tax=Portunus trituberculatus TaxID=210409 RepID=A0A5B7F007_PORTR|nr:hypothetical protein [Portunus trituberculatus]
MFPAASLSSTLSLAGTEFVEVSDSILPPSLWTWCGCRKVEFRGVEVRPARLIDQSPLGQFDCNLPEIFESYLRYIRTRTKQMMTSVFAITVKGFSLVDLRFCRVEV